MEPSFFQTWVPIALGLINLGGWAWATVQSPSRENAKAVAKLTEVIGNIQSNLDIKISAIERRTSTLEDAIKHLPDKDSIHRMEINMEKLSGGMNVMNAEMKAVREVSIMTRDMIAGGSA